MKSYGLLLLASSALVTPAMAGTVTTNNASYYVVKPVASGIAGVWFSNRFAGNRVRDHVNVMDMMDTDTSGNPTHPVLCNGTQDDQTGIQAALTLAEAFDPTHTNGGEVDFPPGKCMIEGLLVNAPIALIGSGGDSSALGHVANTNKPMIRYAPTYTSHRISPNPRVMTRGLDFEDNRGVDNSYMFMDFANPQNTGNGDFTLNASNDPSSAGLYLASGVTLPTPVKFFWHDVFIDATHYTVQDYYTNTVLGTCQTDTLCTTSEVVQNIHAGSTAFVAGDDFYEFYNGTPIVYITGDLTHPQDGFFEFYDDKLDRADGYAVQLQGDDSRGSQFFDFSRLSNGYLGCYLSVRNYDDVWVATPCSGSGDNAMVLVNNGSGRYNHMSTYSNHGWAWDIINFHNTGIPLWFGGGGECNNNYGCFNLQIQVNDRVYINNYDIGFNGGAPGSNSLPDIDIGLNAGVNAVVLGDGVEFKRSVDGVPTDPDGNSNPNRKSFAEVLCESSALQNVSFNPNIRFTDGIPSTIGCGPVNWNNTDPLSQMSLWATDTVLTGAQTGGGGPMVDAFGTGSVRLPMGSTGNRPDTGATLAQLRYNSGQSRFEASTGNSWGIVQPQDTATVAGAGSTIAGATRLSAANNTVTSTNPAGGVQLPVDTGAVGEHVWIFNRSGSPIQVYPSNGSVSQIEALGVGVGQTLASGIDAHYYHESSTEWRLITNPTATFNGRGPTITSATGDYTYAMVTGAAPLDSPTFTTVLNSSGLINANANLQVTNTATGGGTIGISSTTGNAATLKFLTSNVLRWAIVKNASTESGSNAGSNLSIISYDDTGATLATVFGCTRSSGQCTLGTQANGTIMQGPVYTTANNVSFANWGTGASKSNTSDYAGSITAGTSATTTPTVTFATAFTGNRPTCIISIEAGGALPAFLPSLTGIAFTYATAPASGSVMDYSCTGHP